MLKIKKCVDKRKKKWYNQVSNSRVTDGKVGVTYVEPGIITPTVWAVLRETKLPFCFSQKITNYINKRRGFYAWI